MLAWFPARYEVYHKPPVEASLVPTARLAEGEAADDSGICHPPPTQRRRLDSPKILQDSPADTNFSPLPSPEVVNITCQLNGHTALLDLFHKARTDWKGPEHEVVHPMSWATLGSDAPPTDPIIVHHQPIRRHRKKATIAVASRERAKLMEELLMRAIQNVSTRGG